MYSFYSYTKPELLLRTLEGHLGATTMARVMRTYHERWRYRHPSSDDFYAVASEVSGRDLSWFFKPVVEGTRRDRLRDARARPPSAPRPLQGRVRGKDGTWTVTDPETLGDEASRPWATRVVVRRLGSRRLPHRRAAHVGRRHDGAA